MAAVTWKNIAPVNSAGVLDSINTAGQQIGEGFAGIGDAITGYADDRTARETDQFVADLMRYKDRPLEADAFIDAADNSFLDMSRVNTAREDVNADATEIALFGEKAKIKSMYDIMLAETQAAEKAKAERKKKTIKPLARADLNATMIKKDGIETATTFWPGSDSAAQDFTSLTDKYIKSRKILGKDADMARRLMFNDAVFDKDMIDEHFFTNGKTSDENNDEAGYKYFDGLLKAYYKDKILEEGKNQGTSTDTISTTIK